MQDSQELRLIAREAVDLVASKVKSQDAETMMITLSIMLAIILNNIMDNVSESECYLQIDNLHYLVDRLVSLYQVRASTPKNERPNL